MFKPTKYFPKMFRLESKDKVVLTNIIQQFHSCPERYMFNTLKDHTGDFQTIKCFTIVYSFSFLFALCTVQVKLCLPGILVKKYIYKKLVIM